MKRLIICILCLLMLITTKGFAITKVNGKISKNTVWILEKSPYLVTKTVTVKPNATLTIEPGVTVNFVLNEKEKVKLVVEGTLIAAGTEGKKIKFTSESEAEAVRAKQWGGIVLNKSQKSIIEYCQIEGAANGIGCFNSSPKISNNQIRYNEVGIVCEDFSSPEISFNDIRECGIQTTTSASGIACSVYSSPRISNNNLERNIGHGITVSTFSAPLIENNNIHWNCGRGILVVSMSDPMITNNEIYMNGTHCGITCYESSPIIMGNYIHSNDGNGISLSLGSSGIVINNTIVDNGSGVAVVNSNPKIFFNTLSENNEGISIIGDSRPIINYNHFKPNKRYAIKLEDKNTINTITGEIDARENWWEKGDMSDIEKSVFVNNKDAKINIDPVRKDKISFDEYPKIHATLLKDKRETKIDNNYPWHIYGDKIIFSSYRDGNWEIYLMNKDVTVMKNLTNNPASDEWANWSPDGKKITFTSKRDNKLNQEIYVISMEDKNLVPLQLTEDPSNKQYPAWSPNGEKIAFRDEFDNLYLMEKDGSGKIGINSIAYNKGYEGYQTILYIWPPPPCNIKEGSDVITH
ncbi:MAG: right-handed parallel beta-helix repeat-containing protein [bacterium]